MLSSCLILPDPTEKPTYIRFLVSNPLAGAVIGKGGSTINDFQSQSGARIQLSRSHEFFPGTTDRIIMISGTIDEILRAVDLIVDKLLSEVFFMMLELHIIRLFLSIINNCFYFGQLHAEDQADDVGLKTKLRLIVPNSSCGSIIGKAGATIKYEDCFLFFLLLNCSVVVPLKLNWWKHFCILLYVETFLLAWKITALWVQFCSSFSHKCGVCLWETIFEVLQNGQILFEPRRSEKCFCDEQVSSQIQLYIVFVVFLDCFIKFFDWYIFSFTCLLLTLNPLFSKLIP